MNGWKRLAEHPAPRDRWLIGLSSSGREFPCMLREVSQFVEGTKKSEQVKVDRWCIPSAASGRIYAEDMGSRVIAPEYWMGGEDAPLEISYKKRRIEELRRELQSLERGEQVTT